MTLYTPDDPPGGPVPYFKAVLALQRSGLGSIAWLGSAWVEALGDYGGEWLQFVTERIGEDVRTQHLLMQSTSPDELHAIQAEFLSKAADQYSAETGRLSEIGQNFLEALYRDRND